MRKLRWSILASLRKMASLEQANLMTMIGLIINGLLFVATVFLAYYALGQWRAVDKTLTEIKAQTPAVLESAKAAADSAAIARSVADASDATTKVTLEEMKKQSAAETALAAATNSVAATAAKQLDMSERPLLVFGQAKMLSVVLNSVGNLSSNLDLQVENKGHSPALDVAFLTDLAISSGNFSPKAELTSACHKLDRVGPLAGTIIPPGEKSTLHVNTFDSPKAFQSILSSHLDPNTGSRQLMSRLSVCVLYKSSLSKQVHHTALLYDLVLIFSSSDLVQIEQGAMTTNEPIYLRGDQVVMHTMEIMNGVSD
jgi:hypothetical protein